jgi:hypothetical protein
VVDPLRSVDNPMPINLLAEVDPVRRDIAIAGTMVAAPPRPRYDPAQPSAPRLRSSE